MSDDQRAYKLASAARAYDVSLDTIRRAIRSTGADKDGNPTFPPPLRAKRDSKGALRVKAVDLEAWFESWPDA